MISPELKTFASKLADAARLVSLAPPARTLVVENKASSGSFDPVTEVDRAAERAMRKLIEDTFPDHGIVGEEYSEKPAIGRFHWSLDPIDGTRSFTCGLPSWTTLIALLDGGQIVLGIIDAPRLDERYVGDGTGSWCESGGHKAAIRSSGCVRLEETRLSTTDPYLFSAAAQKAFTELRRVTRTTRYGHDAYAYARLAAGTLDLVVECGLKPHDYNALIPVVRGAGGVFGDWSGGVDFASGNVIAAATPELYEAAVVIMRQALLLSDGSEARR
jgi:histidinol phosphatase-like enzyme (inositol monophosphatase family)